MQIKVYLADWFFNAGIVGFIKILEHSNRDYLIKKDNYIEFDSDNLKDFADDYFKYFFDKYNVAESLKNRISIHTKKINSILQKDSIDKEDKKKLKDEIKNIEKAVKYQNKKVEKFDKNTSNLIERELDKLESQPDISIIEEIVDVILNLFFREEINQKITLDSFKDRLSKNYFGQPSFLNVCKSKLSYEEQKKTMYKDYISNIIEIGYLQDILDNKHNEECSIEYLKNKLNSDNLTKDIEKIFLKLIKIYEKAKDFKNVREEISKFFNISCSICGSLEFLTEEYSEKHFSPLAVSSDNMRNSFWNQNVKFPICDVCKLMLFCIPAGMVSTKKIVLQYEKGEKTYKEKDVLSFVNLDSDIKILEKTNKGFENISKKEQKNNPYVDLILNIVEENKQISEWQLQNIFVVEFENETGAFSKLEYFNIKRYVAQFLCEYSKSTLENITNYKYKLQIMDCILKNKSINLLINERIHQEIVEKTNYGYNSYLAVKTRIILNLLKKGDLEVKEEIERCNKKVYSIYRSGAEIHNIFKQKNEENKLNGYTYKMLNAVKAGKTEEFMDILIRLYMSVGKEIPVAFLEIMQETNLDFATIGHSFISGLTSNYQEKSNQSNQTTEGE